LNKGTLVGAADKEKNPGELRGKKKVYITRPSEGIGSFGVYQTGG